MESIIYLLVLFITCSFLLKVSFYPLWGKLAVGIMGAIYIGIITPWITELSPTWISDFCTQRSLLLNLSVCVTLEAAIMIAFCFSRVAISRETDTPFAQAGRALLVGYPGLTIGGVGCFIISNVLYALPGISFHTLPWIASAASLIAIGCGSEAMKRLLTKQSVRLELLFLVNLFIIILTIILTGY